MTLKEALDGPALMTELDAALASASVRGIAYDSRKVEPGYIFFAFPGSHADGAQFAANAMNQGALPVVSESRQPQGFVGPWLQVQHGREALPLASANFYNHPDL